MKKSVILLSVLMLVLLLPIAHADDLCRIGSYYHGFEVLDARIRAHGPLQGDGVSSHGLIGEEYNLGLDGEGKENAKLASSTMSELSVKPLDLGRDDLPYDEKWHFDVTITLVNSLSAAENGQYQREIILSFYDFSRYSQLTVRDTDLSQDTSEPTDIEKMWCTIPIDAVRVFEDLYLQRVCALFPHYEE